MLRKGIKFKPLIAFSLITSLCNQISNTSWGEELVKHEEKLNLKREKKNTEQNEYLKLNQCHVKTTR